MTSWRTSKLKDPWTHKFTHFKQELQWIKKKAHAAVFGWYLNIRTQLESHLFHLRIYIQELHICRSLNFFLIASIKLRGHITSASIMPMIKHGNEPFQAKRSNWRDLVDTSVPGSICSRYIDRRLASDYFRLDLQDLESNSSPPRPGIPSNNARSPPAEA